MHPYGKTENLYARDPKTRHVIPSVLRVPEVGLVDPAAWLFTEKLDGTNVRLIVRPSIPHDPFHVELRGRSDAATLPKGLTVEVNQHALEAVYMALELPLDVVLTLYGEAYGAGIQKGGVYSDTKRVRFFDLHTSRKVEGDRADERSSWWRPWSELIYVTRIMDLNTVPIIGLGLNDAIELVRNGFHTTVTEEGGTGGLAEGVVARTDPYLFTSRGDRVVFKLKTADFKR